MANIILAQSVRVGPMFQIKVTVVSNAAGMIVIEPRSDIVPKYKVREDNGVAEVLA